MTLAAPQGSIFMFTVMSPVSVDTAADARHMFAGLLSRRALKLLQLMVK